MEYRYSFGPLDIIYVNLQAKISFKYKLRVFAKIISIPDLEYIFRNGRSMHCRIDCQNKLYDASIGFVTPLFHLRQCIPLFAVAEG